MAKQLPPKPKPGSKTAPAGIPTGSNPTLDLHKLMEKQQFGSLAEVEAFKQKVSKAPIPKPRTMCWAMPSTILPLHWPTSNAVS